MLWVQTTKHRFHLTLNLQSGKIRDGGDICKQLERDRDILVSDSVHFLVLILAFNMVVVDLGQNAATSRRPPTLLVRKDLPFPAPGVAPQRIADQPPAPPEPIQTLGCPFDLVCYRVNQEHYKPRNLKEEGGKDLWFDIFQNFFLVCLCVLRALFK